MLDRTQQPIINELTELNLQHPEVHCYSNGTKVYLLNAGEAEVVRIDVLIHGGRWHQTQLLQSLFTNRMLREGTRRFTSLEISEKLDYYGAWLELSTTAEYSFLTLYSLNRYLPQTLDILESLLKEPVFPEEKLQVIVNANLQQFHVNLSKVDFLAHRAMLNGLYGNHHPCGRLVNEEDYLKLNPEVLKNFYQRYYNSSGCTIYLSGKVTQDCLRRIETLFGSESWGCNASLAALPDYSPQTTSEKRLFVEYPDALQNAVRLGCISMHHTHPDYCKFKVLIALLGGYFGSRLMSNIREDKGYTYGITASLLPYPDSSLFVIHTETAHEYTESLIREVYHEVERLQTELVDESELYIVRNYMLGEMCRNYDSAFSLADAWIFVHTSHLSETYFDQMLQAIRQITPGELRRLANNYLCKENLKEVIAGQKNI